MPKLHISIRSSATNQNMSKKSLDAPILPKNIQLASIHAIEQKLVQKEINKDECNTLKAWLQHNWVKLDELDHDTPIYAKPYSRFDYKYMMNGSQDNVDKLILNMNKTKIDAYMLSSDTYSVCKN